MDPHGTIILIKSLRRAPGGGIARLEPELPSYKGGQFIDNRLWFEERRKAADSFPGVLDAFGDRLQFLRAMYEQNAALLREHKTAVKLVPLTTIEAHAKTAIREVYEQAFLLGKRSAGNLFALTADDKKALAKTRADEFYYLRRFLSDMRAQQGVMPYEQRMDYYRAAAREAYWLGWTLANRRPDRLITWDMGATEHCRDCLRFHNHGPYTAADFWREVAGQGYLPQSGKLECKGYFCQCRLRETILAAPKRRAKVRAQTTMEGVQDAEGR